MGLVYDNYKHSPASGNMFIAAPDAFVWRYGLKNWQEEDSARQAMGNAAEFAVAAALIHDMPDEQAELAAVEAFDARMKGEVCEERECVGPIVREFLKAMRPLGKPIVYQGKTTLNGALYELRRDIVVKTDFEYADFILDTKATLRCPSEIKPDHARQFAAYAVARNKPVKALYATPKKHALYDLPQASVEGHWRLLVAAWRRIEALDALCESPHHATKIIPFNPDSFYWDDNLKARAAVTWNI